MGGNCYTSNIVLVVLRSPVLLFPSSALVGGSVDAVASKTPPGSISARCCRHRCFSHHHRHPSHHRHLSLPLRRGRTYVRPLLCECLAVPVRNGPIVNSHVDGPALGHAGEAASLIASANQRGVLT